MKWGRVRIVYSTKLPLVLQPGWEKSARLSQVKKEKKITYLYIHKLSWYVSFDIWEWPKSWKGNKIFWLNKRGTSMKWLKIFIYWQLVFTWYKSTYIILKTYWYVLTKTCCYFLIMEQIGIIKRIFMRTCLEKG